MVRPVTVSASPCSRPASSSAFMTTGTPPMRSTSVMTYRPKGFTSARCGTRSPMRLKSASVELDLGLVGDGQQVQHGVGRTAERHEHGDRVLEGLLGEDRARGDALPQHLDDGLAGATREPVATAVDGRRRRAAGQRHAERLGDRGHRVGGVHAAAGALARADGALDLVDLGAGDEPAGAGADGLERVDDRDVLVADATGHGRSGVEEDARTRRAGPRPSACPGSDLSQPASMTMPSMRSACMTVSTESAMTSRDTSEKCMPSWPIEMPSDTEMVPNSSG